MCYKFCLWHCTKQCCCPSWFIKASNHGVLWWETVVEAKFDTTVKEAAQVTIFIFNLGLMHFISGMPDVYDSFVSLLAWCAKHSSFCIFPMQFHLNLCPHLRSPWLFQYVEPGINLGCFCVCFLIYPLLLYSLWWSDHHKYCIHMISRAFIYIYIYTYIRTHINRGDQIINNWETGQILL